MIYLKWLSNKKKKLKNDDNEFIYFFYKNLFNDLNDIKNSNFEYNLKRCQKKKKVLFNKRKRIWNNDKEEKDWRNKNILHFNQIFDKCLNINEVL